MRWTPRAMRVGVVLSLMIPTVIILFASGLQAQFRPPNPITPKQPPFPQPQPPLPKPLPLPQPPKFERVWTCGKCGKVIGNDAFAPGTCQFCGVKIINGIDPIGTPPNPNLNPNPVVNPNPNPIINPNPNPVFNPDPQPPIVNTNPVQPPNPQGVNEPARDAPREPRSSSAGLIIGLIVAGIVFVGVILAAMGVAIYLTLRGSNSSEPARRSRRRR